jgi:hypothetical protein
MDDQLIIEIWETFKDYIPEKTRDTAASQFVDFLQGKDVDEDTLKSLLGYDSFLDSAVELVLDTEEEFEDEEDQEEDGWDWEEDEE